MIKVKNIVLPSMSQMRVIIYGMRSPLKSWDKSDSTADEVGTNDYILMKKLCKAGTEHRKFMRMIPIYMTINAPIYWWKEFDTYKVGTVRNSTSTMHTITRNKFKLSDFSTDILSKGSENVLKLIIEYLNELRVNYLKAKDKEMWNSIIALLPESYNQEATVMLNYETLNTIYRQRKDHKLQEWRDFCDILKTLPFPELIITESEENNGEDENR